MARSKYAHYREWQPQFNLDGTVGIPLTQGKVAIIDHADLAKLLLLDRAWQAHKKGRKWYACMVVKGHNVKLHQFLFGKNMDHVNRDTLDNRACNMRPATVAQQSYNRRKQPGTKSQYKGLKWFKRDQKWEANITKAGRVYYLGRFQSEEDAARAYDRAAKAHFGEFACLNFH